MKTAACLIFLAVCVAVSAVVTAQCPPIRRERLPGLRVPSLVHPITNALADFAVIRLVGDHFVVE
jgi:hypothetical protein